MANGQSIVIKGEISGAEDLVIAGRVEGTIRLANCTLTLAEGAEVNGGIEAGSIVVSGTMTGSLHATTRVDIRPAATVGGEIHTPVLVVDDGAVVSARVEMPKRSAAARLPIAV
jgi:cytoskeletal protein CcmA (bactofilin family)